MSLIDARDVPADPTSAERLAQNGLDYRLVDMADSATAERYLRAVSRGFLGDEPTKEAMASGVGTFADRRNIGVFDPASAADLPVATVHSWVTPLTVPGGAELPMWAISVVTVAATHRRRGIARALVEGELRAASEAGLPMAGLTVSEATIYGRYGFGSAIPMSALTVDTRRAGWAGAAPEGSIQYVERDELVADLGTVHDRVRRARAGNIAGWKERWEGFAGLSPADKERERVRGVRFLDGSGELRGVLVYTLEEKNDTFRFAMKVRHLAAETPEALAVL